MYIREHRLRAALTQQALADKAGVCRSQVADWERGHKSPNLESMARLAKAMGIRIGELFDLPHKKNK